MSDAELQHFDLPPSQELVPFASIFPELKVSAQYAPREQALTINCTADAVTNADEIIRVFARFRRFLPPVTAFDVLSDITMVSPGANGLVRATWRARTEAGERYLAAIAMMMDSRNIATDLPKPSLTNDATIQPRNLLPDATIQPRNLLPDATIQPSWRQRFWAFLRKYLTRVLKRFKIQNSN
jgi:hypothetical protein